VAGPDRDRPRRAGLTPSSVPSPPNASTGHLLVGRQEPGEVEPIGAGATGGVEVGATVYSMESPNPTEPFHLVY
jgi:hypothetical protein